jgi:hypothetical protein
MTEPPKGSRWAAFANELRAHPNVWMSPDFDPELTNRSNDKRRINKGENRTFRPIGWWKAEVEDGQLKVCYTPPPEAGDQP